jgi:heptosyltransferase-2
MPKDPGFIAATYTPPFPQPLPSNVEQYLQQVRPWKLGWRRARRTAWLALNGQLALERTRIEPQHRRILWIHSGMPQVGDSLMDLACRDLFKGRDHEVDLLIDPHLVALYEHDDVFRHVYGDATQAARNEYDLVLLLTASSHSLRQKFRHFRRVPYAHLQGFYNGPEFHRTLFGYYRLSELLGLSPTPAEVLPIARAHMIVSDAVRAEVDAMKLPERFVALCIGGVRGWRTYAYWDEVVERLRLPEGTGIVLLGAANGTEARDTILAKATGRRIVDRVAQDPLPRVYEVLRRSALAVCADGGLLHVANAARVPTISLFAERIDPLYRLTPANDSLAFYTPGEVSDIEPERIAQAIERALARPPSGVVVERVAGVRRKAGAPDTVDQRLR